MTRADTLYKQGVRLYSDKKWAEAETAFVAAWALNPTFDVAYNLGSAEYQLGKYQGAAEHLSFALHHWPLLNATSSLRKTAQQRFDESRAFVGALTVKVNVAHANVLVDGKQVGQSPLEAEVFVGPGAHTVEAKLTGYEAAKESVQAAKGAALTIALTLSVAQPASAGAPSVDAAPAGRASASAGPVAPPPPPPPPEQRSLVPAIIAGGVAVGAAAVGVGLIVASNGKRDDMLALSSSIVHQDHQRCVGPGPIDARCAELVSTARDRDTFDRVAIGAFVGAGVLAAGGLTYLLWPAPQAKKASIDVHAAPVLGAGYGGMILGGAF